MRVIAKSKHIQQVNVSIKLLYCKWLIPQIRSLLCDIFGVPLTYETHMCLGLLVKMQIVE